VRDSNGSELRRKEKTEVEEKFSHVQRGALHLFNGKEKQMKRHLVSILCVAVAVPGILTAQATADPVPLVEFHFDGNFNNTGTLGGTATVTEVSGRMAVIGEGLAGQDTGFDNTSATAMGGDGGLTTFDPGTALNGLKSFTVTGWFKSDQMFDDNGTLVYFPAPFKLYASNTGRMGVTLRNSGGTNYSTGWTGYAFTNQWVFFAVSYDGTSSSNNLCFYVGDTNASSTMTTNLTTLNAGTLSNKLAALRIGCDTTSGDNAYDGLMDELRIFGSTSSASGALTALDIEGIRQTDISLIPEPATVGLLFGGMFMLVRRRSR
jgi:hypothetical protein